MLTAAFLKKWSKAGLKIILIGETSYTPEELKRLAQDTHAIYLNILANDPVQDRLAIMTVGAPEAGKTTLMQSYLKQANSH